MASGPFEGRFSDGERANALHVTVVLEADGLSIRGDGGEQLAFWRLADLEPAAPIKPGSNDVLLRHAHTAQATLFVKGPGVGREILARAPGASENRNRKRIVAYGLIPTAIIAALGAFLTFGPFSLTKTIADHIPDRTAEEIGSRSVKFFQGSRPACNEEVGIKALKKILTRLETRGGANQSFHLDVVRWKIPNAFAVPGKHIVLLSGFIDEASSPEEVAGVLAHEMGHGIEKDPEAQLVRTFGMQVLLQLFSGQSGDSSGLTFGAVLLQLRYSRDAERLADSHARELLRKAQISPNSVGEFFSRLSKRDSKDDGAWQYLSTHPASRDRAELFLAEPSYPTEPLLTDKEWADARSVCGKAYEKKPDGGAKKENDGGGGKKVVKPDLRET